MGGRPSGELANRERFSPLFPDAQQEATRYYQKTGIFPTHHVTIVRESIIQEHPWVTQSLFDAFEKSKKIAMDRLYQRPPTLFVFGNQTLARQRAIFGEDPYVYGLRSNTTVLDAAQTYSMEQGLTSRKQPWEEMFPKELIESTG